MNKIYVALLDKENRNKALAFGVWDDTPENRATAASWDGYELVDEEFKQAWDGAFYREGTAPIRPVEQAKELKREEINKKRDEAEQGGFEYMGKIFDSDPVSCQRISCAAQAMQYAAATIAGEDDPKITWTTQDNSTIDLTPAELAGLIAALAAWSNSCHEKATALKQQVEACETTAEVEAIDW